MKCSCGYKLKEEVKELGRWVEHKPTIEILHCDWCGENYCPVHLIPMKKSGEYWLYCETCDPQIKTREDIYKKYSIKENYNGYTEKNTART